MPAAIAPATSDTEGIDAIADLFATPDAPGVLLLSRTVRKVSVADVRAAIEAATVNEETDEVRPVGKSCLAEYTGGALRVDVLAVLTGLRERFAAECGGALESLGATAPLIDVVALASAYIARHGFVSVSAAGPHEMPTSWRVRDALTATDERRAEIELHQVTAEQRAQAAADIALVLDPTHDTERDLDSSFLANLREVAGLDWVQFTGRTNRVGLVSALPSCAARIRERLDRLTGSDLEPGVPNAYIGEIKQRREFTGTLVSARPIEHAFGTSDLVLIDTTEGRIKVFGKFPGTDYPAQGVAVTLVGTITEHDEYQGMRQTRISRVKLVG